LLQLQKIIFNGKLKVMKKLGKNVRVVIAMSGGVDSSVAAALLKQAGFDVVGIMMKFWKDGSDGKNRCCSIESEKLARMVSKKIGIPFYVINAEKEFKKTVVDYFLKEYKKGNTPNPCVVCNKEIKFGFLINKALSLGSDFIATGHYARISPLRSATNFFPKLVPPLPLRASGPGSSKSSLHRLFMGRDSEKDQSYFLWQLNQKQLSRVLFPVGGYTKPEVRKLAKEFDLPTAETPESMEVCFVQDSTNNFLKKYLKTKPGKIINKEGKVLGEHAGLWFYTIGQRRALEIQQGPWYVVGKDFKKNILIVSKNQKDLNKKELVAGNVNWISPVKLPVNADVKIRYKSNLAKAKIFKLPGRKVKIVFVKPQKAITPGQSVVFYAPRRSSGAKAGRGEELLGGGVIE
jgi:tRNA-specific 2-thiouridylase